MRLYMFVRSLYQSRLKVRDQLMLRKLNFSCRWNRSYLLRILKLSVSLCLIIYRLILQVYLKIHF